MGLRNYDKGNEKGELIIGCAGVQALAYADIKQLRF